MLSVGDRKQLQPEPLFLIIHSSLHVALDSLTYKRCPPGRCQSSHVSPSQPHSGALRSSIQYKPILQKTKPSESQTCVVHPFQASLCFLLSFPIHYLLASQHCSRFPPLTILIHNTFERPTYYMCLPTRGRHPYHCSGGPGHFSGLLWRPLFTSVAK